MRLVYGGYSHALNEASFSISRETLWTQAGVPYAYRETWNIKGRIHADTLAELTAAIQALEVAYAVQGRDIALKFDGGSNTAHRMISAAATGGVRVTAMIGFPVGDAGQYVTYRDWTATVEAEFPLTSGLIILQWEESVELFGGGPADIYIECINAPPQHQRLQNFTTFRATQSGSAIGYAAYPGAPGPIWPGNEDIPQRRLGRRSPRQRGSGSRRAYTEFGISWSYSFHSASPLSGSPHRQPA